MHTAIITKYLPATTHRGARIIAKTTTKWHRTGKAEQATFGYYEFEGDTLDKHAAVAEALAKRLSLSGSWIAGDAGLGYVFVNRTLSNHDEEHLIPAAFKIKPAR